MILRIKEIIYSIYRSLGCAFKADKRYHGGREKPVYLKIKELFRWIMRENYFNYMYYAFGLNISGANQAEYIGRNEFFYIKHKVEKYLKKEAHCEPLHYDVITKDKFYANSVFRANNIDCVDNIALVYSGKIIYKDGKEA